MHGNHWGSARVLNDSIIPVCQRKSVDRVTTVLPSLTLRSKKSSVDWGLNKKCLRIEFCKRI
jgi:hypothetical protein